MKRLLKNIFSVIVLVVCALTIYEILKLDVLPNKYLIPLLVGEGVLFLLGLLLYNLKNKFLIVLGILLYLISIAGNIFGYYYLSKTNQYIEKTFAVETYKVTTHYYLITGSSNPINELSELDSSQGIQYNKNSISIDLAMKKLGNYDYHELGYGSYTFYTFTTVSKENGYFLLPKDEFDFLNNLCH